MFDIRWVFPPGHVLFTLGLLHLHQRAESSFGGLRWSALLFQNVVVFEAMVVLKMVKTNQIWFEMDVHPQICCISLVSIRMEGLAPVD